MSNPQEAPGEKPSPLDTELEALRRRVQEALEELKVEVPEKVEGNADKIDELVNRVRSLISEVGKKMEVLKESYPGATEKIDQEHIKLKEEIAEVLQKSEIGELRKQIDLLGLEASESSVESAEYVDKTAKADQ